MIRALLRWLFRLGLVLVALIVALVVFKDELLRRLAQRQIRAQTGLYAEIERLHVGFTDPVFTLKGFKVRNSAEFGGGTLIDIPELHLEYYPDALKSGRVRLKVLKLDLAELNLVRNKQGETNLVDFVQQAANEGRKALQRGGAPPKMGFAGVDTLHLSLGTVRYVDLANPSRNRTAYFGIRDMEIRNIRDEDDLYGVAGLVLLRSGIIGLGTPEPGKAFAPSWPSLSDILQWVRSRLPTAVPVRSPSNEVSGSAGQR